MEKYGIDCPFTESFTISAGGKVMNQSLKSILALGMVFSMTACSSTGKRYPLLL